MLVAYYPREHLAGGVPHVPRLCDGELRAFQDTNGMAYRILPGHRLRVRIVVHIKHRALNSSDASNVVFGYIAVEHRLRAGKDDRVGTARAANFFFDQAAEKLGIAILFA